MPTYQYECDSCSHRFEQFQSITAPPVEICPECGGRVTRLISGGSGFLFKGSGFYTTDHRSEDYKKREKADKEKTSSPDASKSDVSKSAPSKPASKAKSDSA